MTVVGYNTKVLKAGGQLVTAQFLGVDKNDKFKVSDLKVDGYQNNEYLLTQAGELGNADIYFCELDEVGISQDNVESYYWYDFNNGDDTNPDWIGGHWIEFISGQDISPENDKLFDYTSGFWFYMNVPLGEDEEITLMNSGKVCPDDYVYSLRAGGNVIGNSMPTKVFIRDMSVDGYQNNEYILTQAGELGNADIYFCEVDEVGVSQDGVKLYYWYDFNNGDDTNPDWIGGHWVEYVSGTDIGDESPDAIEPGDGVWFYVNIPLGEKEVITLEIPSPLADHSAE